MKPSMVPEPRQGGKIRGTVSYAIYGCASRLACRCDPRDKPRSAALFDCGETCVPVVDVLAAGERRQFEKTNHENVRRLALVAGVEGFDVTLRETQRLTRELEHDVGLLPVALEPSVETAFRPASELPSET